MKNLIRVFLNSVVAMILLANPGEPLSNSQFDYELVEHKNMENSHQPTDSAMGKGAKGFLIGSALGLVAMSSILARSVRYCKGGDPEDERCAGQYGGLVALPIIGFVVPISLGSIIGSKQEKRNSNVNSRAERKARRKAEFQKRYSVP